MLLFFSLYGVMTRSEIITWIYLIHLGSCATLVLLISLDFASFIHFFPKPPVAPVRKKNMIWHKYHNVPQTVPITPPVVKNLENIESKMAEKVAAIADTAAHPLAALNKTAFLGSSIGSFSYKTDPFPASLLLSLSTQHPALRAVSSIRKSPVQRTKSVLLDLGSPTKTTEGRLLKYA